MIQIPRAEELVLGVPEMDREHHDMVVLMSRLIVSLGSPEDGNALILAREIGHFTARHFDHEECSMVRHDYDGYASHRREHDELLRQLDHVAMRLNADGIAAIDDGLIAFLIGWLVGHIVTHDARYAEFLKSAGLAF